MEPKENPIKAARIKAGLTQGELAEKVGVLQHHISRWENGTRNPGTKSLKALAKALGCSITDLIDE